MLCNLKPLLAEYDFATNFARNRSNLKNKMKPGKSEKCRNRAAIGQEQFAWIQSTYDVNILKGNLIQISETKRAEITQNLVTEFTQVLASQEVKETLF